MPELISPVIFGTGVAAVFTTRSQGSEPKVVAQVLRVDSDRVYLPVQRHTDMVHFVEAPLEPSIADAVLTERKGIVLGVRTADCVPVLLYDHRRGIIGAVHAGWRGTAAAILAKTIHSAQDRYACRADDISLAIGPSIGSCCYEVDPDVAQQVIKATGEGEYAEKRGSKFHLDLREANRLQAVRSGVLPGNIWVSSECTHCSPERFFSYRYAKVAAGRQGGFIVMR